MLKQTDQDSRKYKIAAFNARLHRNSICPANHNVSYANGWYYYDGEPKQAPDITAKAREMEEDPHVMVFYNSTMNTYTLSGVTYIDDTPSPVRGEVPVV